MQCSKAWDRETHQLAFNVLQRGLTVSSAWAAMSCGIATHLFLEPRVCRGRHCALGRVILGGAGRSGQHQGPKQTTQPGLRRLTEMFLVAIESFAGNQAGLSGRME